MLVGIMSDSHDHVDRIKRAVRILQERGVEHLVHAGDFVAPFALIPIVNSGLRLHAIFGNNDGERRGLLAKAEPIGGIHVEPYRFELGGKRFLLNHAPLSEDRIPEEQGRTDYVVTGHTHIPEYRRKGDLVLINPGELCGWLEGLATFGILDIESGKWDLVEL